MGKNISRSTKIGKTHKKKIIRKKLSASLRRIRRREILNKDNSLHWPNNSQLSIDNSLNQLIQSLDAFTIDLSPKNINPIKLEFQKEINDEEFTLLVLNGIEYAKEKFKFDNLKNLKKILNKLHEIDIELGYNKNKIFPFLESQNKLEKAFKKDLILSLVTDETITDIDLNKNINDSLKNTFSKNKEFIIYQQKEMFIDAKEYEDQNVDENIYIRKFEDLLYSNTILNTYKKVLEELYNIDIVVEEIKQKLIDFRMKHKIYFIEMPKQLFGLTLYDGTILLNNLYIKNKFIKDSTNYFIVFFTLFHEYTNILSRLLRGDNNYFKNTGEFTKDMNKKIEDSGKFFEETFLYNYLKVKTISEIEANYLLDKQNYIYGSIEEFGKDLVNFIKINKNILKSMSRVSIGKKENDYVEIKIGCGFSGIRRKTFLD